MLKIAASILVFTGLVVDGIGRKRKREPNCAKRAACCWTKTLPMLKSKAGRDPVLEDFDLELSENGPDWVTPETLPFVSRLTSDDKLTEIFTWALKRSEDSYLAYGLVWNKNKKTGEVKTFRLEDKGETLKNTEVKNLGRTSWLGCVYYSITDMSKGGKRMFLLGGLRRQYPAGTPQSGGDTYLQQRGGTAVRRPRVRNPQA